MHIVQALGLLRPYDIDCPKRRFGPKGDGGYVLADRVRPEQAIFSYGISTEYRFDTLMAEAGHEVFMFDHTIDGIVASNERMHWFQEGVAGAPSEEPKLGTLADHIDRYAPDRDNLILKMDVEGAEFPSLLKTPLDHLSRFEQICLEVHGIGELANSRFRERFVRLFRKINSLFTLFHVHANNYYGEMPFYVDGMAVANLLELTYIRSDLVQRRPSQTVYPTSLDYPNTARPEMFLWFFPFFPTAAAVDELVAAHDLVKARGSGASLRDNFFPVKSET